MGVASIAQLGQVLLQLGFWQSFTIHPVVPAVQRDRMVPDLSSPVNRSMKTAQPFRSEHFKPVRLAHVKSF